MLGTNYKAIVQSRQNHNRGKLMQGKSKSKKSSLLADRDQLNQKLNMHFGIKSKDGQYEGSMGGTGQTPKSQISRPPKAPDGQQARDTIEKPLYQCQDIELEEALQQKQPPSQSSGYRPHFRTLSASQGSHGLSDTSGFRPTKSGLLQLKMSQYLTELSQMQSRPILSANTHRLNKSKGPNSKLNRDLEKNNEELNLRKSLILQQERGVNFKPTINEKSKKMMMHKKQTQSLGQLEQITKKKQIESVRNLLLWGKQNEEKKEKNRKVIENIRNQDKQFMKEKPNINRKSILIVKFSTKNQLREAMPISDRLYFEQKIKSQMFKGQIADHNKIHIKKVLKVKNGFDDMQRELLVKNASLLTKNGKGNKTKPHKIVVNKMNPPQDSDRDTMRQKLQEYYKHKAKQAEQVNEAILESKSHHTSQIENEIQDHIENLGIERARLETDDLFTSAPLLQAQPVLQLSSDGSQHASFGDQQFQARNVENSERETPIYSGQNVASFNQNMGIVQSKQTQQSRKVDKNIIEFQILPDKKRMPSQKHGKKEDQDIHKMRKMLVQDFDTGQESPKDSILSDMSDSQNSRKYADTKGLYQLSEASDKIEDLAQKERYHSAHEDPPFKARQKAIIQKSKTSGSTRDNFL